MTRIPFTGSPSLPIQAALQLMQKHGFRHLPIEEGGKLIGIVSDRDILSVGSISEIFRKTLGDIMIKNPFHVGPETPVDQVIRDMNEFGFGSTVVVDENNSILGIFTEKDAMKVYCEFMAEQETYDLHANPTLRKIVQ